MVLKERRGRRWDVSAYVEETPTRVHGEEVDKRPYENGTLRDPSLGKSTEFTSGEGVTGRESSFVRALFRLF